MTKTVPPRAYPGMPHEDLMELLRWQEDNGVCPTSVYRPFANEFTAAFYRHVRDAVDASDGKMRHHRMTGSCLNSPMVYFAETEGQTGYVVYAGVEHRNDQPLDAQRTILNAWYFYGGDDEKRVPLIDSYFDTQDPKVLADMFLALVAAHHAK